MAVQLTHLTDPMLQFCQASTQQTSIASLTSSVRNKRCWNGKHLYLDRHRFIALLGAVVYCTVLAHVKHSLTVSATSSCIVNKPMTLRFLVKLRQQGGGKTAGSRRSLQDLNIIIAGIHVQNTKDSARVLSGCFGIGLRWEGAALGSFSKIGWIKRRKGLPFGCRSLGFAAFGDQRGLRS